MSEGKIFSGSLLGGYKKKDVNAYLLDLDAKAKEKLDAERQKVSTLTKEKDKLARDLKARDTEIAALKSEIAALKAEIEILKQPQKQEEEKPKQGALSARFKKAKSKEE
ncbi:MAG: hypothetical protein IKJ55_03965 [Clostridia bacterium]|nr:hypothetical protein [Clostridia bacterium]